jgi:hypothetical protein
LTAGVRDANSTALLDPQTTGRAPRLLLRRLSDPERNRRVQGWVGDQAEAVERGSSVISWVPPGLAVKAAGRKGFTTCDVGRARRYAYGCSEASRIRSTVATSCGLRAACVRRAALRTLAASAGRPSS